MAYHMYQINHCNDFCELERKQIRYALLLQEMLEMRLAMNIYSAVTYFQAQFQPQCSSHQQTWVFHGGLIRGIDIYCLISYNRNIT